ncbi:MAG: hypothetical protein ACODAJ_06010, partial [Planctomycetota bacterium]
MPATLFAQLTQAFRAKDTRSARGLLERAAKQSADVIAAGDHERLQGFCGALALVHIDTEGFELSPELRDLRAYLAALVQLTRAALDRGEDLQALRQVQPSDYRPAILACIKKQGAPSRRQIAEAMGVSPRAIEHPLRSLLSAKTITATTTGDPQCYALTPLGFVVARRLEERAGGGPQVVQEAPSPERPILFAPEAHAQPQARRAATAEAGAGTVELTVAASPADQSVSTEMVASIGAEEMADVIALELEECDP